MTTVYVPLDSSAVAAGANMLAAAFKEPGARVVRNGSRGMAWAEPLVEVATDRSRLAFANVHAEDASAVLSEGSAHAKCLGPLHDVDYQRLKTTRCCRRW